MNIDVAYGRDLDDSTLEQLQYMEADAYAFYESIDSDEDALIVGAIPSETLKQFKRRTANTLFLMKITKAKSKSRLLGIACLSKSNKDTRYLHTVFVRASCRRKGIGTALVRRALLEAKKMKCSLCLGVNPLNNNAMKLYDELGFKICKGQKLEMQYTIRTRKQSHGRKG